MHHRSLTRVLAHNLALLGGEGDQLFLSLAAPRQ
jgi:hypothetical protein